MISNMMASLGGHTNAEIDEGMVRHMILNSLRSYRTRFSNQFGELVICCDDKNYWRKDIFPYYKASRKKTREKSELDWNSIFNALNNVRDEIKEFFPYKVIQIDRVEADDIIATIVKKEGVFLSENPPILILSGDKDFIQLQIYSNVKQYDPTRKKWISHNNPSTYLKEHVLKGDVSDGVPNVLSPDDTFVMGKRQRPLTKPRLLKLNDINTIEDKEIQRNWHRNSMLIDLEQIPSSISGQIMKEYEKEKVADRGKLLQYFIDNRLKNLMQNINDF
jgi:hypothetical protein